MNELTEAPVLQGVADAGPLNAHRFATLRFAVEASARHRLLLGGEIAGLVGATREEKKDNDSQGEGWETLRGSRESQTDGVVVSKDLMMGRSDLGKTSPPRQGTRYARRPASNRCGRLRKRSSR